MANSKSEGISRMIEKAKEDPEFFHALIWNPEKVLSSLGYLSRSEKAAILALKPEDLVSGLASGPDGGCGATCSGPSCAATCDKSAAIISDPGENVIQPAQAITSEELTAQIIKSIGQNFSRFRR